MTHTHTNITQKKPNSLLRLVILAGTVFSLTACATTQPLNNPSKDFGQATAHNRAVQEVLPTAEQKNNTYIPADAGRQTIAREKYRENDVEEPRPISTN